MHCTGYIGTAGVIKTVPSVYIQCPLSTLSHSQWLYLSVRSEVQIVVELVENSTLTWDQIVNPKTKQKFKTKRFLRFFVRV